MDQSFLSQKISTFFFIFGKFLKIIFGDLEFLQGWEKSQFYRSLAKCGHFFVGL